MAVNQLKAGAALNYVIIVLNTLTGLLYTPFMLRCLGQNEYGIYSLVSSTIAYLTLLDFGFGNSIVRYTAKFRAEGKKEEQWELFGMFMIVYCLIGFVALCGGLALYFNVDALFDKTMTAEDLSSARIMMLLMTLNLGLTFPFSVFSSIIIAYENFVFQRVVSIVRILLSTAVLIVVLLLGYKAVALVVVHTIFNLSIIAINYFYCRYKLKIHVKFTHFNFPFFKEISIYSFWIFLNAIMDKIYWSTGQFILGIVVGPVAVAIFSVAIMLQTMYMSFSTSISGVLLPKVTAMVARENNPRDISNLFIRTGRIQNIVMSLILSGFLVFGQGFIDIWAGNDYSQSFIITTIFFVALYIPLIQNTGITILQARNQMRFRSTLYVIIALISLVFQVVLSRTFGPIGCAIAVGGALILGQGLVMNIYYNRKQQLDIPEFWKQIGQMSIIPILFVIAGNAVGHYVDFSNVLNLVCGIIIYVALYIPTVWKFSLNNYERELIGKPIRNLIYRRKYAA